MRALVVLAAVSAAAPAFADPAPCAVTVVRAPDDVRAAVESWLANERCEVPLVVRIIPTDGELYIYAQDDRGRVHERTVPDAQSAGVLIASWTADDGIVIPVPETVAPAPVAPPPARDWFAPTVLHDRAPAPAKPKPVEHWLTFGAAAGSSNSIGVRAELEVFRRGGLSGDMLIKWGEASMNELSDPLGNGYYLARFRDASALVGAHYTWKVWDLWHVRAGLAGGIVASQLSLQLTSFSNGMMSTASGSMVSPIAEGSLLVGRSFGEDWEFDLGPIATISSQGWYMVNQQETLVRTPGAVLGFAGIRRAL
ncbi:MAG TPA: hypothetical protein VFQ65_11755 [Kofleriaceae bacterium]|nr:hypothetical protein [Kofleriaceae bacterium]